MKVRSRRLTPADAGIIKALLARGWLQSDIASLFGCNGGRIGEISKGAKFAEVDPADLSHVAVRARLAEIQAEWNMRLARQIALVLKPVEAMV